MSTHFTPIFVVALCINAAITYRSSSFWKGSTTDQEGEMKEDAIEQRKKHTKLLKQYLSVYLLAALSDWLQGPYVYALYDAYGYSQHLIAVLFVAGFGSSMVFGSFIGGWADSCGRRKFTIVYCVVYAASCATKHFKDFGILMLGRLLGGIATSLLFSVFDSWLIRAHNDAGLSSYLSKSFAAASYGNSIVAITAGLLANKASTSTALLPIFSQEDPATIDAKTSDALIFSGGYLNPFDIAFFALILCGALAGGLWSENYGQEKANESNKDDSEREPKHWSDSFVHATKTTFQSSEILFCGLISSLFEGSMYIFVFMWTPSMKELTKIANPSFDGDLPFGLIFSTFMVSCMAGSSTFSILIEKFEIENLGLKIFSVATVAFAIMSTSASDTITLFAFLLFEFCVGMYFPMMCTMKSRVVPENERAAIYNLYRIPLNFIVLFSLLTDLTYTQSFMLCTIMLMIAVYLQMRIVNIKMEKVKSVSSGDEEEGNVPLLPKTNLESAAEESFADNTKEN